MIEAPNVLSDHGDVETIFPLPSVENNTSSGILRQTWVRDDRICRYIVLSADGRRPTRAVPIQPEVPHECDQAMHAPPSTHQAVSEVRVLIQRVLLSGEVERVFVVALFEFGLRGRRKRRLENDLRGRASEIQHSVGWSGVLDGPTDGAEEVVRSDPRVHAWKAYVRNRHLVTKRRLHVPSSFPSMIVTASLPASGNLYCDVIRCSTATKIASLTSFPSNLKPAVAFTATFVHPCNCFGTTLTASSIKTSKLRAAANGSPANELKPGRVILNTSYSNAGAAKQLWNLYTWIREPVDPASSMRAYWTIGREGLCGERQWTVFKGSGSVSGEWGALEMVRGGLSVAAAASSSYSSASDGLDGAGAGEVYSPSSSMGEE